jgi:hypothetical protein
VSGRNVRRIGRSVRLRWTVDPGWRPSPGCCAGCTTPPAGSTLRVLPGTTLWLTLRAGRSCATTTWSRRTSSSATASPLHCSTSSSPPLAAPSTTWPSSPASAYRSTTPSTRRGSAGDPRTGRRGCDSSPTPTDWTGTAGRSCSPPWTTPSTASKQPPGAPSTPVIRTPSRCGTGPVAATATTAQRARTTGSCSLQRVEPSAESVVADAGCPEVGTNAHRSRVPSNPLMDSKGPGPDPHPLEQTRSGVTSTATRRSSAITQSKVDQSSCVPPAALKMSRSSTRRRALSTWGCSSSGPTSRRRPRRRPSRSRRPPPRSPAVERGGSSPSVPLRARRSRPRSRR